MQKKSDDDDVPKDIDKAERPKFLPYEKYEDPVKNQKIKTKQVSKKTPFTIPEKASELSAKIIPSIGKRIFPHCAPTSALSDNDPRPKYIIPRTKEQEKKFEANRTNTYKKFCKKKSAKMTAPAISQKISTKLDFQSPEPSSAKVAPRKLTPTASWLYPDPQTSSMLALKKPKSGIYINETEEEEGMGGYDSFDLVYRRKPRPQLGARKKKRRRKLKDIEEEAEDDGKKKKRKRKKKDEESDIQIPEKELAMILEQEFMGLAADGEGDVVTKDYLTKQFRRKVSMMSNATSYKSQDFATDRPPSLTETTLDRYAQKYRRESEIRRYQPMKRRFRRGTLESHSFTNIYQPILKEFYFGSKQGTMHQGDEHLLKDARNMQGICIPVAAVCYSFLKHPNKWTSDQVDEILDVGSRLYISSLETLHLHSPGNELKPEDLDKYCYIRNKKLRFTVEDPEVSGFLKSTDRTIFNITKALTIFFARQKAGILQTQDTNIAIWKDRYYYMFDGKPRTKDLYYSPTGTAIMANFYDIPAIVTVLLQRSLMQNWPFVIYPVKIYKVLDKDEEDQKLEDLGLDARSNYNILNENKAVLLGSYDLGDKCFGFTRNKQSLPMAVVCLVYSRITPPSAWHRQTVNKILTIGNQLYIECMKCDDIEEMKLNAVPAFFTVGPYMVEIYIYVNRIVDLLYTKCNCQLKCSLEEFFRANTNAIVQIANKYLAVWKQRNMFFIFDPYPRGVEGFTHRDGYACVSMHGTLESLVDVISHNFVSKDSVFNIHALKVCKINRDPVQSTRFPKHIPLDEFPPDEFKKYQMRKSKKPATEKPITVDYTALAMRNLLAGESPDPSIFDIGSTVESLALEQIPPLLHAGRLPPSKMDLLARNPVNTDVIADLDSPSLSETQVAPPRPTQPKDDEELPFMDLDSFGLTQEEIELQEIAGGEGGDELEGMGEEDEGDEEVRAKIAEEMERQAGEDEDFYYTADEYAQVRRESLEPDKLSENINTDITFFPIKKEILYPTYIRGRQDLKSRMNKFKKPFEFSDSYIPKEPTATQSEELRKETNFIDLPDDTQIIRGTKNMSAFGEDIDIMGPFVCIMADVVAKKYSILSWTPEIIDYILKCGAELQKTSKFRYDQVTKVEIPKITLGKMKFACQVEYVFDSYSRHNIMELSIEKILFVRAEMGVLITQNYACALIYRNHLFYMYDPFGNNEVGLSEGLTNTGYACWSRFKDVHSLVIRIMHNKKKRESNEEVLYTRFVLSMVRVKRLPDDDKFGKDGPLDDEEEQEFMADGGEDGFSTPPPGRRGFADEEESSPEDGKKKKSPKNKVGYRHKHGNYVIEGTRALEGSEEMNEEEKRAGGVSLQKDHFACICACLLLLECPIQKWDTKKVDEVLDNGNHVYSHAEDLELSDKRTIKNILIGKHFFDINVKKVKIENWRDNKNLSTGIDTLLRKKITYFMVQFPDRCCVVHKSAETDDFHIFYPHGLPQDGDNEEESDQTEDEASSGIVAGWLRCDDLTTMKKELRQVSTGGYFFYTFEVTAIRDAPKDMLINYRLNEYEPIKDRKPEDFGAPFFEDITWLKADPIPWSRSANKNPEGSDRGTIANLWHNWDIEYKNDLYSLVGNINQDSDRFPEETRGKQALCNLVVCIGMLDIYELAEWNAAVVDSILVNGDQYFQECVKDIKDDDYELSMDDLKKSCVIFPFQFTVEFKSIVEGTMFLVRSTQFNLYKALRLFFENHHRRCGIITCTRSNIKKNIAFGKVQRREYFMFESDASGGQMFLEGYEKAYILRMTSLNRLLHVLTLTLRGGDFFMFDVVINDLQPIS